MSVADLSRDELEAYRPRLAAPDDFDELWRRTLDDARGVPLDVTRRRVSTGLTLVEVEDVEFSGFAGDRIKGWFVRPAAARGPLPVIVEYTGYGAGRGLPHERLMWPAAGYAYFFMDTRGQGSEYGSGGETPDPHGSAPAFPGFVTRGVLDIEQYYYRRVITDAVRAVDAVRTFDGIDLDRVVVAGGSQGGGLALAVAGLVDGLAAALLDVPFLCHVRRGVELSAREPYRELAGYLTVHRSHAERVFRTLSYVDGVHHAARASAPALFAVGLRDDVCPPSTVYAAYHAYGGPAELAVYEFSGHEAGLGPHATVQMAWLEAVLNRR